MVRDNIKGGQKEEYSHRTFAGDIWNFLSDYRGIFAISLIVRLASELGSYVIPFLLGEIIDVFTNYQNTGSSYNSFYYLLLGIAAVGIIQVWMRSYSKIYIGVAGAKARQSVRQLAMNKLMDLELEWHEHEDTGSKIQRINAGSNYLYRFFSSFLANNGTLVFMGIVASVGIFFFIGWKYALFAFIYAAVYLSLEHHFNKEHAFLTEELHKFEEKISGKIHESASNVLSVKSLGLKGIFQNAAKKQEDEYYQLWYKTKTSSHNKLKYTKSFGALGYALFILVVGFDFVNGFVSLGSILVYAAYFNKLRDALDRLSDASNEYIQTKSAVGRLMTILGRKVFDRESNKLLTVSNNWKKIEFNSVYFAYKGREVLRDFTLTINRGEKIGIAGSSGCGKSTLVKLILGLYTPKKGEITIDGIPVQKFKHSSLTNTITAVLQDSEMFDMSLEDNISISSEKKDPILLSKAVEISALSSVVSKLPKGFATLLGEKGYKVSGGERQRIGIARAIYKNSAMLIFDEATSHLDSKTEAQIQNKIETKLADKTLMIIAHRLSTLKKVDKVCFMEKGRIVEDGTFSELIDRKGKFNEFYRLQSRKKD